MRVLNALGKHIGSRNDRAHPGDDPRERGWCWRIVDRLAGWLYTR